METTQKTAEQSATASEIRHIVGPLEDEAIARILDVGATGAEVLAAYTWFRSNERLQDRLDGELRGRTARVYDILSAEDDAPDEPDR